MVAAVSVVLAVGSQAAAVVLAFLTGDALGHVIEASDATRLVDAGHRRPDRRRAPRRVHGGPALDLGRQALGVEFDMRNALYTKLMRLSFGFYDRHQTGQLMSRATVDLQSVRFFLGYGLIFFFQHILTVVGVTVVMFFLNWRLALVAAAITPVLVVLAYRYSHVAHPVLRDVQQKLADVATVAEENIVGVHVVKAFAQEDDEQRSSPTRSERGLPTLGRREPPARALRPAARVPAAARAGRRAARRRLHGRRGELGFGEFFTFNVLVVMLVMPLRMLGMWIGQAQRATASGERIFEVIDEPEEVADRPGAIEMPPATGRVRFERRLVRYDGSGRCSRRSTSSSSPADRRADRPHGLRQDDARLPRPALLRRDGRAASRSTASTCAT